MTNRFSFVFFWIVLLPLSSLTVNAMTSSSSSAVKRILVTGGNKGIGKAICERLLSEWPVTHVLLASRSLERGQQAVQDIQQALGGDATVKDRLVCIELDTSNDKSVQAAAALLAQQPELYGIINNAGVGWGYSVEETVNVNYFGPRRVNDALIQFVKRPGGRIVNVASASGPNFVEALPSSSPLKESLPKPWKLSGGITDVDDIAKKYASSTDNGYGLSKALLNAYTVLLAKQNPDLIINACTPGFILTDLTAGTSAKDPPSKGAVPPCFLMMDDSFVPTQPTGRYYGSDCQRSPMHCYRSPGDPPYASDEDLLELPASAKSEL